MRPEPKPLDSSASALPFLLIPSLSHTPGCKGTAQVPTDRQRKDGGAEGTAQQTDLFTSPEMMTRETLMIYYYEQKQRLRIYTMVSCLQHNYNTLFIGMHIFL